MVNRPQTLNSFEFIAIAALRTAQLMRGCVPRVPTGHKPTTTAQLEIIAGQVAKASEPPIAEATTAETRDVPTVPKMVPA